MGISAYASAIQEAIASGDLDEMRKLLVIADEHIKEYGNVPLAIELLKTEILKMEYKQRSGQ